MGRVTVSNPQVQGSHGSEFHHAGGMISWSFLRVAPVDPSADGDSAAPTRVLGDFASDFEGFTRQRRLALWQCRRHVGGGRTTRVRVQVVARRSK